MFFKSFKFFQGEAIAPDEFGRTLAQMGYRSQEKVSEIGDFSRRGGIIDVFPVTFDYPIRVEWEIDKIRLIRSYVLLSGKPFWVHNIVILLPFKKAHPPRSRFISEELRLDHFIDIRKGDYVVHQHHGVGVFQGIKSIDVNGRSGEHMVIRYQGRDRLYVPIEQMHLVQKYVALGSRPVKIHRLGSGEWKRTKSKAKKSVAKVALELLNIQALRKALGGFAFSKDAPWQKDFEATFPFTETPDQSKALEATKKDMESPYAMDRLLCGDVGYGKTEVAMRAAFKCVLDSKQVAFLVPTTILAEQHYQNFKRRLEKFPLRVEMLSRFKTNAQQKEIIRDVQKGTVDIVIGTHRLVSGDVSFKDLGLIIIDEEQRFGVGAKEKLKKMRVLVDALTLTATPIPRTLYLSLMGSKDISVINTPPAQRMAVETHVVSYNRALMRDAIAREVRRSGQVFFVHNRVEDIEDVKLDVERLAPSGTRVEFAHGQMSSKVLEKIMLDFLSNKIDVLVSTTIIESGIDVPNANTIIVHQAEHFGLADLHQLRGRVGRFNRKAYAYFVIKDEAVMSREAQKRLEAIKDFSDLGSGFKIAMQDLEIRGAGNVLGVEQHGYISSIGFDLYCRLLREAVSGLSKGRLN